MALPRRQKRPNRNVPLHVTPLDRFLWFLASFYFVLTGKMLGGGEGTPLTPFTSHLFLRICMDLCWWLTAVAWLHGPVHPQFMLEQTLVSDLPCAKSEARCKHEG